MTAAEASVVVGLLHCVSIMAAAGGRQLACYWISCVIICVFSRSLNEMDLIWFSVFLHLIGDCVTPAGRNWNRWISADSRQLWCNGRPRQSQLWKSKFSLRQWRRWKVNEKFLQCCVTWSPSVCLSRCSSSWASIYSGSSRHVWQRHIGRCFLSLWKHDWRLLYARLLFKFLIISITQTFDVSNVDFIRNFVKEVAHQFVRSLWACYQ